PRAWNGTPFAYQASERTPLMKDRALNSLIQFASVVGVAFLVGAHCLALGGCLNPQGASSSAKGRGPSGGTGPGIAMHCNGTETRSCCITGTQTCSGGEFGAWGPCLDRNGATLSCCIPGEFGPACDGGTANDGGESKKPGTPSPTDGGVGVGGPPGGT